MHIKNFTAGAKKFQVLNIPNCNPIKPVLFLERKLPVFTRSSPFLYRFWFCSHGYTNVSVVNFPSKLTKEISFAYKINTWHRRTRGKFILLNLKSIGKIVKSFAFEIYRIAVCLQESRQQTPSEKESVRPGCETPRR